MFEFDDDEELEEVVYESSYYNDELSVVLKQVGNEQLAAYYVGEDESGLPPCRQFRIYDRNDLSWDEDVNNKHVSDVILENLDPDLISMAQDFFGDIEPSSSEAEMLRQALIRAIERKNLATALPGVDTLRIDRRAGMFYLENSSGPLCIGTYAEVLDFCDKYYPRSMGNILKDSSHWKDVMGTGQLYLRNCRAIRRISPIIDKVTKINQLREADFDHPCRRYKCLEAGRPVFVVNEHTSLAALHGARILTEQEFLDTPADVSDNVYLVNVIKGDSEGATNNKAYLLDKAFALGALNQVQVHLCFDSESKLEGTFVFKGRPHNHTMVVELHPDGDLVGSISEREEDKTFAFNTLRNGRVLGGRTSVTRLKQPPVSLINKLARVRVVVPPGCCFKVRMNAKLRRRKEAMKSLGCNSGFDFSPDLGYAKLTRVVLFDRVLHCNDVGFYRPDVAFRSMGNYVVDQGKTLYFDSCWKWK